MLDKYEHFNAYARTYQMFRDNLMQIEKTSDYVIFRNNICNQILFLQIFNVEDCVNVLPNDKQMLLNDVNNFTSDNH